MKPYAVAGLLLIGLETPALAAAQHYAVEDTVGNCSVIDATPKRRPEQFLVIRVGYDSVAAAQKALGSVSSCHGIIQRGLTNIRAHECPALAGHSPSNGRRAGAWSNECTAGCA